MDIRKTEIPGCLEIHPPVFPDRRGRFVKTFQDSLFSRNGLATGFAEEYYTVSHRGVLRGLHFQLPPMEHHKVVYCVAGEVLDAVVDLRVGSPAYGRFATFALNAETASILYLPPGLAHGFLVLSGSAIMLYKVTTPYSPGHDSGILWNSAGIPWPDRSPVLSERDGKFPPLSGFQSPFLYREDRRDA